MPEYRNKQRRKLRQSCKEIQTDWPGGRKKEKNRKANICKLARTLRKIRHKHVLYTVEENRAGKRQDVEMNRTRSRGSWDRKKRQKAWKQNKKRK